MATRFDLVDGGVLSAKLDVEQRAYRSRATGAAPEGNAGFTQVLSGIDKHENVPVYAYQNAVAR